MLPEIFVTTHDAARLSRVLERFRDPFYAPLTNFLGDELRRATGTGCSSRRRDDKRTGAISDGKEPRETTLVWPGRACWAGSRC
jgi:hypothetical protein